MPHRKKLIKNDLKLTRAKTESSDVKKLNFPTKTFHLNLEKLQNVSFLFLKDRKFAKLSLRARTK